MEHVTDGCTCPGKKCATCKEVKCHGAFTNSNDRKSGIKSPCRKCANIKNKKWRDENQEYNSQRKRKWNQENTERNRKTFQSWRIENYEHDQERHKIYRSNHLEKVRTRSCQYGFTHRAQLRKYEQQRRKNNPSLTMVKVATRRAHKMQAEGKFTAQEWGALKARYNYTCLRCSRQEPEIKLTADHIIPISKQGSNYIDNIQPLCQSCNSIKGQKVIDFRPQNP